MFRDVKMGINIRFSKNSDSLQITNIMNGSQVEYGIKDLMKFIHNKCELVMQGKKDEPRYQELLKEKKELEKNRPHGIDDMRRWKHAMGKILQELELYNK